MPVRYRYCHWSGSMMTAPGLSTPAASASSIILLAILSLTLPAGLKYSSLPRTVASGASSSMYAFNCKSGVPPTKSVILSYVLMVLISFSSFSFCLSFYMDLIYRQAPPASQEIPLPGCFPCLFAAAPAATSKSAVVELHPAAVPVCAHVGCSFS